MVTESEPGANGHSSSSPPGLPNANEVADLLQRLTVESTGPDSIATAVDIAALVAHHGIVSLSAYGLLTRIAAAASNPSAPPIAREGSMRAIAALAEVIGLPAEPYLVPLLPFIIDRIGDKVRPEDD